MAFPMIASLLLATSSLATPVLRSRQVTTDPDDGLNFEEICGSHDNLNTFEKARDAWEKTTAAYHLDTYITSKMGGNADNWMNDMYQWTFSENGGTSAMDDCGTLGGCGVQLKCNEFFDRNRSYYYWVLQGVKGLHSQYTTINRGITEETVKNALRIGQISDDFSKPPADRSYAPYLSAAFNMGAGLAVKSNPAAGVLTVFTGVFAAVGSSEDSASFVDPDEVEQTLLNIFEAVTDRLDNNLRLATGNVPDGDYASLPNSEGTWDTPVANFFDAGTYLVSENAPEYQQALDDGYERLLQKLVDVAMQTADIKVMAFKDHSAKCEGLGQRYLGDVDGGRCFQLVRLKEDPGNDCGSGGKWDCKPKQVDDDVYTKLTDKYKFSLEDYYRTAALCAASGSDEVDPATLPTDGSIPNCFFNPRAFKGRMTAKVMKDLEEFE